MDQTLKVLSLVSGNPSVSTRTSANLRRASKQINESNEAGYRSVQERKEWEEAKSLYKQIKGERATLYPAELSGDFSNWLTELRRINPAVVIRKGDYIENLNESDDYFTNGLYQFDGNNFFKVKYRAAITAFDFPKDFRNPLYFSYENVKINNSFSNQESSASEYGEYFRIFKDKVKMEHITQDDLDIARNFNKNFDKMYEWSTKDYKIRYKNLVYFIYYEVTDNVRRENGRDFYGVVSSDDYIILAYVLPKSFSSTSFGKKKVISINRDILYLQKLTC